MTTIKKSKVEKNAAIGIAKRDIEENEWIYFDSFLNSDAIELTSMGKKWVIKKIFEKIMKD